MMITVRPSKKQIIYSALTFTGPVAALGGCVGGFLGFLLLYFMVPIEDPVFLARMFLLYFCCVAVGGYLGGVIGPLLGMRFFQDAAELVFTDKEVIGHYGKTIFFTSKIALHLEQIDRERLVGSNFWERNFKGGFIWSLDGRKIFFIRHLYNAEQLNIVGEKLGVALHK